MAQAAKKAETKAPEANKPSKEIQKSATIVPLDRPTRLRNGALTTIEHSRRELFADVAAGVTFEQVLDSMYFGHFLRMIRPLDVIECFCEDGSWEAKVRVMFVGDVEVITSPIYYVQHDAIDPKDLQDDVFEVQWISPSLKWAVVHKATGERVADGLFPKAAAVQQLRTRMTASR